MEAMWWSGGTSPSSSESQLEEESEPKKSRSPALGTKTARQASLLILFVAMLSLLVVLKRQSLEENLLVCWVWENVKGSGR